MITHSNLISQPEALSLLHDEDASFVDASWYLPAQNRNGREEFESCRIPGAVFFDIDTIADPDTDLPHMLPSEEVFSREAGKLGLTTDRRIIVYDGPGMFSAPRVWWALKAFGANRVRVLEGGIDGWKKAEFPIESGVPAIPTERSFKSNLNKKAAADMADVLSNITSRAAVVLDARPTARFDGKADEPRPGLRSGHIPGSRSLPFDQLIENGTLKSAEELDRLFANIGIAEPTPVITSCGSGVTAAVLALALAESGRRNIRLYDGSWAEWGKPDGPEVHTS